MTAGRFLLASIRHYWRWHAGLALGVAIAASVICGSLAVGDSVRATLRQRAVERLGRVQTAVIGNDRFFTRALSDALPGNKTALIAVRGTVAKADGSARVGNVNVLGVPDSFWQLALRPAPPDLSAGAVCNEPLGRALGTTTGEAVVIRMEKPGILSKDAPLSGESDQTVTLRLPLTATVPASALGDFTLNAGQTAPKNVFVSLAKLQEVLGQPERVNLALADSSESIESRVAAAWSPADANLTLRQLESGEWEIATSRVFLDPLVAGKLRTAFPAARGVLTYLVNEIRGPSPAAGTPYSMATAAENLFDLAPKEVAVTQWTADDLELKPGDPLTLKYYYFTRGRQMDERTASFTVKSVLPMSHPAVRPDWTPNFPGVMDKPDCRDWNPGIKMDMTRIRPKDQQYWENHRGTPKLFLPLETGQELWGNRFGSLTSLRLPAEAVTNERDFLTKLQNGVAPADWGLRLARPALAARQAVDQSYDLGGLFLGMSFFLIVTALLLTALMFLFTWENRAPQIGLLAALGLHPRQVRRLMMLEAALAAAVGALAGIGGGLLYARLLLDALSGAWAGAVGGLTFVPAWEPATAIAAAAATCALALATVWLTGRRLLGFRPKDLVVQGGSGQRSTPPLSAPGRASRRLFPRRPISRIALGWGFFVVLAGGSLLLALKAAGKPIAFFAAGALLMLSGVLLVALELGRVRRRGSPAGLAGLRELSLRNVSRRPGRSLAVAGLLAAGVFMISAMNAFHLDAAAGERDRASGTGGFAFVGESTLPIYEDLNTADGREAYGLDDDEVAGVSFVPFRMREGDEASCLNLERPQNPRVLGVLPELLEARHAFNFSKGARDWSVLENWPGNGPIPAVMDANYVQYTLKAKLGDTLEVAGDGDGVVVLRIAALLEPSVLQGSAVISESAFLEVFAESGGYRFFLVDAPADRGAEIARVLMRQLEDRGFSLARSALRLDEFNTVQNTYLRIFTALGGLGILLSTAGLGLLLARNVLERRSEFGLLLAVGVPRGALRRMVLGEYAFLLVIGLLIGALSASLAVWPVAGRPVLPLATILGILAGGLFFCLAAARLAMRGPLIEALRSE